jgi:hypothetical protein
MTRGDLKTQMRFAQVKKVAKVISEQKELSSPNVWPGGGFLTGPNDQINTDSLLGPLQLNGGLHSRMERLPGSSSAIDSGNPNFTPPPFYHQRGPDFSRKKRTHRYRFLRSAIWPDTDANAKTCADTEATANSTTRGRKPPRVLWLT